MSEHRAAYTATTERDEPDELREFMLVLRQALLMVVSWIERRYDLQRRH